MKGSAIYILKWSDEAQDALAKVPFFVRKKAKITIEKYLLDRGRFYVTLDDVKCAKNQFIANMSKDIRGYQADSCFGAAGCPNSANSCESLLKRVQNLLEQEDILSFLKQHVKGDLKYHHEFRVSCADCPNCCSQPQIKDFGIIGALLPSVSDKLCSMCLACVNVCPDHCITMDEICNKPSIDFLSCMKCGKCIEACPTGTICEEDRGFRVQVAGRLGRHPRLALEVGSLLYEDQVIKVLCNVLEFYKKHSKEGERFAKIFDESDISEVIKNCQEAD